MITIFILVILSVTLKLSAQTTSGQITSDETWSGTIILTGDVIVTSGTLTIEPGTIVKFATSNDNIVEGDGSHIWLVAMMDGVINAIGTPENRIKFTSTSLLPGKGSYGGLLFKAINNASTVKYCDFEYGRNGINVNDGITTPSISTVNIEHCTISHMEYSGVYGYIGATVNVSHCVISDVSSGLFLHNAATADIQYCYIYDVPTGIVLAGGTDYVETATIDHVTIYNVDMSLTSNPSYWTGYGLYFCNTAGEVTLTNSVISSCTLYGMKIGSGWTVTHDYNCWYGGLGSIENGTVGSNSIEEDPMFWDEGNRDLRLDDLSPCVGSANDGTNMGAWQSGDPWPPEQSSSAISYLRNNFQKIKITTACFPQPFTQQINFLFSCGQQANFSDLTLELFSSTGERITTLTQSQSGIFSWDGSNQWGQQVKAGVYFYRVKIDNQIYATGTIIKQ